MARVLANALLAGKPQGVEPIALELAHAIRACNAGDRTALHKVLAKALAAAEAAKPR